MRRLRPELQFIFQDPYSSLNPRMRIGDAIGEALLQHGLAAKEELRDRVEDILSVCGMAAYHYDRYPHEFSGAAPADRHRPGNHPAAPLHCR